MRGVIDRGAAVLAASVLLVLAVAGPARSVPAQAPADDLAPITSGVSPVMWQACRGVGLAVGVVAIGGTLAGVPPEASEPINDLFGTISAPVLNLFFEACQQIPLPEDPPDCAFDEQVPPLPSLGRPVLVAGLLASELRALDASLTDLGVPLQGLLGQAADDLLACAAGHNPEPEAPAPEPAPATGGGSVPDLGIGATAPPGDPIDLGPAAPPAAASPTGARDLALGPAEPTSTSGRTEGAGVARALLAVGVLAAAAWAYAGRGRAAGPARG